MYYIIKVYYFVVVLSLTYTPILPTFFKNKNVDKIKTVKNVTKIFKKRKKNVFLHLWNFNLQSRYTFAMYTHMHLK